MKVGELEREVGEKQQQMKQLAAELDGVEMERQAALQTHRPDTADAALQVSLTLSSPERAATAVNTRSPTHSNRLHSPTAGERRVKSGRKSSRDRVTSPLGYKVQRSIGGTSGVGVTGEADISLDNEMRLAGCEITDPYDSSEGVGFSDTNLDCSGVSLDEEGAREAGGDSVTSLRGGGGGGGEMGGMHALERDVEKKTEEERKEEEEAGREGETRERAEEEMGSAKEEKIEGAASTDSGDLMPPVEGPLSNPSSVEAVREVVGGNGEREKGEIASVVMTPCLGETPAFSEGEGRYEEGGGRRWGMEEDDVDKLFACVQMQGMEGGEETESGWRDGGGELVDLEALAEEDSGDCLVSTSSSESDLPAFRNKGEIQGEERGGREGGREREGGRGREGGRERGRGREGEREGEGGRGRERDGGGRGGVEGRG